LAYPSRPFPPIRSSPRPDLLCRYSTAADVFGKPGSRWSCAGAQPAEPAPRRRFGGAERHARIHQYGAPAFRNVGTSESPGTFLATITDWGYAALEGDGVIAPDDRDAVMRAVLDCPVHAIIALPDTDELPPASGAGTDLS